MNTNSPWVSIYGNAMSIAEHHPESYAKNLTLRYPIYVPFDGDTIRLTLDNFCGPEPVTISKVSVAIADFDVQEDNRLSCPIHADTKTAVTFRQCPSVTIDAHQTITSDPVSISLKAGQTLCVSLYFADFTLMQSAVLITGPLSKGYFSIGDYADASHLPVNLTKTNHWVYFLSNIDIKPIKTAHTIICYGDSITAQSWPDYLMQRLENENISQTAVIRKAASGTRVLREYDCITYDSYGLKATHRFHHEVPACGADIIIIQQGINDIIHPVGEDVNIFRPMSDLPTAEELIEGLTWYITEARKMNLKIYMGTLLPIKGWRTFASFRETLRSQVNEWIRTTPLIDGYIDFDQALLNPDDKEAFLPIYDSGDHLHPSEKGYKKMAEIIDLAIFKTI